jgi:hypothetical protein
VKEKGPVAPVGSDGEDRRCANLLNVDAPRCDSRID